MFNISSCLRLLLGNIGGTARRGLSRQRFGSEILEQRAMLAGNVLVSWVGTDLVIKGDALANAIVIRQTATRVPELNWINSAEVSIEGINGTTINGKPNAFISSYAFIDVGDFRSTQPGFRILMGAGNDSVRFSSQSARDVTVNLGSGHDTLIGEAIANGTVTSIINLTVNSGGGNDDVRLKNIRIGGSATVRMELVRTFWKSATVLFNRMRGSSVDRVMIPLSFRDQTSQRTSWSWRTAEMTN